MTQLSRYGTKHNYFVALYHLGRFNLYIILTLKLGYARIKIPPPPHRGCQNLLQNVPGNPLLQNVVNLEIMEIVTKTWNLVKLYQKYLEMWSKTVKIFWNSSP